PGRSIVAATPSTIYSGPGAAGDTTAGGATTRGSDFADLMRQVKAAGLMQRRPGYYVAKMAVTGGLLAAAWAGVVLIGDSWWQLAMAVLLAFVFSQLGFLGHDAGHGQIFRSKRAYYLVGLLHGNLAIRLTSGWWVDLHIHYNL